jgi:hypothetical protein
LRELVRATVDDASWWFDELRSSHAAVDREADERAGPCDSEMRSMPT